MAVFCELLSRVSFAEVWSVLGGSDDPAQAEARSEYESLYSSLLSAQPDKTAGSMRIVLEQGCDFWSDDEEPCLQASGYLPGDSEPYALGFRSESELLTMQIDPQTLLDFSEAQIVAQVLADYAYDTAAARAVWNDQAVGAVSGLYESEVCMDGHAEGSLKDTRRELGLDEELTNREKYGFLF